MKILIVDDQLAKCELLAKAILAFGNHIEISQSTNAYDGFVAIQSGVFNLVLLDVVLPLTFGENPSEEGSLWFVREVHRKLVEVKMPLIVGTTQYAESLANVENTFREYLWNVIYVSDSNTLWMRQIQQAIRFAQSNTYKFKLAKHDLDEVDVAFVSALRIPEFTELINALDGGDPISLSETSETWLRCKLSTFDGREKNIIAACADDMGMTAMASLVTRLSMCCQPKVLILTGIMGGNSKRVGLSDLICIEETWDCRAGKITEEGFQADIKSRTCSYKLANKLTSIIDQNYMMEFWRNWVGERPDRIPSVHKGAVACSPAVIADSSVFTQLESQKRKILGVEMEAYGCYDAAHRLGDIAPQVMSIKSVCDLGDNAKNDKYQRYCAALSSSAGIALIKDARFTE